MDLQQIMRSIEDEQTKERDPATRRTRFLAVGRAAADLMRKQGRIVLTEVQVRDVLPRGGGIVYYEVS